MDLNGTVKSWRSVSISISSIKVSALDDIGDMIPINQDAEDLSPYSDNLLSLIYPAKEDLFTELTTALTHRLLSPSSKSELARSCKAWSMPCNLDFERNKTMF